MRVSVVAPSGPCDAAILGAGIAALRDAGFEVDAPPAVYACDGYLAGSDADRCAAFEAALGTEPDILWAARGGSGAGRIADDLQRMLQGRKLPTFVGFSDATVIHALWRACGEASIHGANVTTLLDWSTEAREALLASVRGASGASALPASGGQGTVRAPVFAANLTVLASLVGTPTLPSFAGSILALEDIHEPPYRLDRAMTQLRRAGVFDGVLGLAVGQLTGPVPYDDVLAAVLNGLDDSTLPVAWGVPFGHAASSQHLVQGAAYTLSPEGLAP